MNPTLRLHLAISAIVPIVGVSIGDPNDKTTWIISYVEEPTEADRELVRTIIINFYFEGQ